MWGQRLFLLTFPASPELFWAAFLCSVISYLNIRLITQQFVTQFHVRFITSIKVGNVSLEKSRNHLKLQMKRLIFRGKSIQLRAVSVNVYVTCVYFLFQAWCVHSEISFCVRSTATSRHPNKKHGESGTFSSKRLASALKSKTATARGSGNQTEQQRQVHPQDPPPQRRLSHGQVRGRHWHQGELAWKKNAGKYPPFVLVARDILEERIFFHDAKSFFFRKVSAKVGHGDVFSLSLLRTLFSASTDNHLSHWGNVYGHVERGGVL